MDNKEVTVQEQSIAKQDRELIVKSVLAAVKRKQALSKNIQRVLRKGLRNQYRRPYRRYRRTYRRRRTLW